MLQPDGTTLSELFARTPPLPQEDLDRIVAELRAKREMFDLGAGAKPKAGKAPKAPKLSLDDLLA